MVYISSLMHYKALLGSWVADLEAKRSDMSGYLNEISANYPSWRTTPDKTPQYHDARPEYFLLLGVVLQNVYVSFKHMLDNLSSEAYWEPFGRAFQNEQAVIEAVAGYQTMAIQYAVLTTVSITENTLYSVASCGEKQFTLRSSSGFTNTYQFVLSKINLSSKYKELFRILNLVRNGQHSSGLFFPRDGLDVTVSYGGNDYAFEVSCPVPYFADDMIISLFEWTPKAMWEIITSPEISGISSLSIAYPSL